jgi:MraZ protein
LWLCPMDVWDALSADIRELPLTDPRVREFRRQLFGTASDSIPDKQGRVILPPNLRGYAGIEGQAVIIGLDNHCEIWNPELWRERQERSDADPDARAEHFANLGI